MRYTLTLTIRGKFVTLEATPHRGTGEAFRLRATPASMARWAALRGITVLSHLLEPIITGNFAGWQPPDDDAMIVPAAQLAR